MKLKYIFLLFLFTSYIYSQAPFQHISTSTFNAERVASFGVIDVNTDFLEITNSTQFDNSFIPSIWAHQQSDNRFVLRHFATTNSAQDNGTTPIMIFRTEIRDNLNMIAPTGSTFPWGTTASNVVTRPLFAWENGNTQLMRILANGNVGIGTILPTSVFHTNGTVRFENLADAITPTKVLGTDAQGNVFEYNPTSFGTGGAADADWLKPDGTIATSINDTIYTNGNVGINVQNPTSSFQTNGTIRFENIADAVSPVKLLGTDIQGNVFEYDPTVIAGSGGADADWLKSDNSIAASINDNIYTNGKVGINTSIFPNQVGSVDVSGYSLFAKGGILTEEVRVALSSEWADYVFNDSYKLDSLQYVEEFIKTHKHLKDIPAAEEVKKDGIELGEMNKLLLSKVEELTLYVINLNKKIEAQGQEIEALKRK